jgi:predicted nucleic acid-binding protein
VSFAGIDESAALAAGTAWAAHRRAGGTRSRVIADFLIGAHAAGAADRLLTRDRGFYRRYFESLEVLDPTAA